MLRATLFLTILSVSSFTICSPLERIYASVLGSEDASPYYKNLIQQALREHGVENFETVPVKKMNGIGPRFAGTDALHSFTAFGIWINEALLDELGEKERTFVLYHEAAHYALKHPEQLLIRFIPTPLILAAIIKIGSSLSAHTFIKLGTMAVLTGLTGLVYEAHVIRPTVIKQEQEADLVATKTLVENSRHPIVEQYLKLLQWLVDAGSGHKTDTPWHKSIAEQLEALKAYYESLTA